MNYCTISPSRKTIPGSCSAWVASALFVLSLSLSAVGATWADDSPIRAMPPSVASSSDWTVEPAPETLLTTPLRRMIDEGVQPARFEAVTGLEFTESVAPPVVEIFEPYSWQVVPDGLLYPNYLAGVREPRMGIQLFHEKELGSLWDGSIGLRQGLIRYGTTDPLWPEGWQLDVEAAAFPRLTADEYGDMISCDYRYGTALTHRRGRLETKLAFYHLSSHLADEYRYVIPWRPRINYSRFALVLGGAFYPWESVRVYGEAGYGVYTDGGNEPWEFQFGVDYSSVNPTGFRGAPFLAVNGYLREEVDFGGNFVLQAGWQWRGATGRLARFGLHYLNGKSVQYQFFDEYEEQIGLGFWYDF